MTRITLFGLFVVLFTYSGCPPPAPPPAPSPAPGGVSIEGPAGGGGGQPCGLTKEEVVSINPRLIEVQIRQGNSIDAIDLTYVNPNSSDLIHVHCGGTGGEPGELLALGPGEWITEIRALSGNFVDSLLIKTNQNREVRWQGTGRSSMGFSYEAPTDKAIVSLFFRSATFVDSIGVMLGEQPITR